MTEIKSDEYDTLEELYEAQECAECGQSIEPGEWCDNDDCVLGGDGPPSASQELDDG